MNITINHRIKLLPTEIQNLIYEFNVQYKDIMENVFSVILTLNIRCCICNIYMNDNVPNISIIRKKTFSCSDKCTIIALEEYKNIPY